MDRVDDDVDVLDDDVVVTAVISSTWAFTTAPSCQIMYAIGVSSDTLSHDDPTEVVTLAGATYGAIVGV